MIFRRKNKKDKKAGKKRSFGAGLQALADGSLFQMLIRRHLKFLLFCLGLSFVYIGNKYANEALIHKIDQTKEEVTKLRHKSITVSSELMAISSPSQVQRIVNEKNLGLKFSNDPPKILED